MRAIAIGSYLLAAVSAQAPESLFDGTSLQGWRGDPAVWRAEGGCIVGSTHGHAIAANTYLIWQGADAADFELAFDVQLEGNNSGVQYRSRVLPGDGFAVAGYQCDVHPEPAYFGMLYEEKGAGILCTQGQFVARDADGTARVAAQFLAPQPRDLTQWHHVRVIARGAVVQHEVDGEVVAVVRDDSRGIARSGVIALQVHAGEPMTVRYRNLSLVRLRSEEIAALPPLPMPAAAAAAATKPSWIWDAVAGDGEEVFFRREFDVEAAVAAATLVVSCDNHCRVYVNGEKVGTGDDWASPLSVDIGKALRQGRNTVAVHGWNDGGPAGLALRLWWTGPDGAGGERGRGGEVVTDGTWRCSDDDPDGWNTAGFADATWPTAKTLATVGDGRAVWSGAVSADLFAGAAPAATAQLAFPASGLAGPAARGALQLLEVPRAFGSWVAMCADDKGRLYASDQARGLYRVVPAATVGDVSTIEKVEVDLDGAQGLCWFRGALYAGVSTRHPGLYRVTDSDGDDRLDKVELLRALGNGGEHGVHAVVPAPDGEHLFVLCGNHVPLTEIAASRVPTDFGEDRLLPKIEDPNGHAVGLKAPGGYVCLVDPDGQRWELYCCGFRNAYDLAVRPNGDVVTFDADMEWDMGLPWYRPTRILQVLPGVDYGWRSGSNKWPADYPDAPAALCDIGPASPTGMLAVGDTVLALDWTFGTVYALSGGCSVAAPWLHGVPLPLTDALLRDDAVLLLTGGRGLPSKLLRVPLDPRLRQDLTLPRARFEANAELAALLVPARTPGRGADVLARLGRLRFDELGVDDRIAYLRLHALVLLRSGDLDAVARNALIERLLPLFPTHDDRVDQDLAELLVHLDAKGLLDQAVPLLSPLRPATPPAWAEIASRNASYGGAIAAMLADMPPTGQIAIAYALRGVKHGWTLDQRRALFTFLAEARTKKGGMSYDGYLKQMIDDAWATCNAAEQHELADLVGKAKADLPKFAAVPPKGPGRDWQLAEAQALVRNGLGTRDLASGHNLFHAVGCASCHYFAGEGGNHGPDLTSLGNKFAAADVLESILEPSRVVSDQYSGSVVTKADGSTLFGRAVEVQLEGRRYWEVVPAVAEAAAVRIPVADVRAVEPSKLSPMPTDLIDRLSPDELKDLLAFLLSRGQGLAPGNAKAEPQPAGR